ncbi:protein LAZY 1 [Elaeis guineensis]|uniref:Protein LAZY 1 isoform X2 n=1 Tax=Elaeis guineensis var. tenera TaxID=51953 RepID=A0A6I9QZ80_ELAGV|nr:protein LAZY 1 isoform X2 [Elaeis guineensis]
MKLLGWMHRKFRQNSGDVFKDSPGGGTCNCLSGRRSLEEEHDRRRHHFNPFPSRSLRLPAAVEFVEDGGGGGGGREQTMEELFGGLLAIGTLGIGTGPIEEEEAAVEEEDEAATPGFGAAATVEAIAEKQAEATTETDLMVVSAELEKVLAAEAEKAATAAAAGDRLSSARPSHVSAGSSACPLQGFLFGSPIEIAETAPAAGGRRERRASLGELFMKSRMAEEGGGKREEATAAGGGVAVLGEGEGRSTAGMHLMKKLKRRGSRGSGGGPVEATAAETTFQKILQIFHRKVHPENSVAAKKTARSGKKNGSDCMPHGGGNDFNGSGGAVITASKSICRKEGTPNFKFCLNAPSLAIGGSDSNGNREHWIKTDADYLVLEL